MNTGSFILQTYFHGSHDSLELQSSVNCSYKFQKQGPQILFLFMYVPFFLPSFFGFACKNIRKLEGTETLPTLVRIPFKMQHCHYDFEVQNIHI
jgi:hypothetical protein